MSASNNATLSKVIHEYSRFADVFQYRKKWNQMSEDELWDELCLCMLTSNVPYELAKSAFLRLLDAGLLEPEWILRSPRSARQIAYELSRRIYLPRKKDGSCRKYRFPNSRARNIVNAAKTLYSHARKNSGLSGILEKSCSEREARDFLAKNITGIGLKQASHFLRNIGYSNSLAIIDTHVIAFLRELEVESMSKRRIKTITPEIYMRLEETLQDLCDRLDLNLSIFDMAIWHYMRGK